MADPGSLDDLLSSEIDESAVSALVGSLESQLASSTNRELPKIPSDAPVNNNHISSLISNATTTNSLFTDTGQVNVSQKVLSSHTNNNLNYSQVHGNKSVQENQILGITSIINSTAAPAAGVNSLANSQSQSVNLNVSQPSPNSSARNLVLPHQNNISDSSVHISSPIPGGSVNSLTNNTCVSQTVNPSNSRGTTSASNTIYNLANIASEQKPMTIAQNGNIAQKGRTVIASPKPQFIVKQEGNIKQEVNSPFYKTEVLKDGTNLQQTIHGQTTSQGIVLHGGSPVSVVGGRPMVHTAIKTAPTGQHNVITVRAPSNQQVTVVRPPTTSSVQFVNPVRHVTSKGGQVRVSTPIRMTNHPQQISIAPRQHGAGNTITLGQGFQLPPNTILMKNEHGQLMLVSTGQSGANPGQGQVLATKVQNVRPPTSIAIGRPQSSQSVVIQSQTAGVRGQPNVIQNTVSSSGTTTVPVSAQPGTVINQQAASAAVQPGMMQNVEKCKNFLSTLIKLAQSQPAETVKNVRELIQGLIDGKVEPQTFTENLQVELKSSPQPYLVPFLKKSLPLLRQYLILDKMTIDGVKPPPPEVANIQQISVPQVSSVPLRSATPFGAQQTIMRPGMPGQAYLRPNKVIVQGGPNTPQNLLRIKTPVPLHGHMPSGVSSFQTRVVKASSSPAPKEKQKFESLKDGDDDIIDVATMGGVNLSEESKNILATNADFIGTQIRSCKDEAFLFHGPLMSRIHEIAKRHGLDEVSLDVANMISHATQERLRDMAEKLSTIAEHRIEIYKMDNRYEVTNDVRTQIKFLEEIDKLEKKRHEEQEREVLLRAIKSRSKNEDPEQLKLKQKAKELQAAEMEEVRQREANLTALAAIGPRKKRKIEAVDTGQASGSSSSTSVNGSTTSSSTSLSSVVNRPRTKRVNLRDMLFLLEQERSTSKSNLLYKTFLK